MAISPIFRNQPAKAALPLLFCREIARYYHRLFSATYSLRTPPVMHMMKLRARKAIGLELCGALLVVLSARAQMPLAAAEPPDGETLLKQQCASLGPPTSRGS